MNPIYLGLIRHLLTMGAGALASNGVISSNQTEIVVGSAIGIVGVIWSVLWQGRMRPNKTIYESFRKLNKPIIIIEVGNLKRGLTWRICLNHIKSVRVCAISIFLAFKASNALVDNKSVSVSFASAALPTETLLIKSIVSIFILLFSI
jgi:hypothetical protein